jgi:hypothetical protein
MPSYEIRIGGVLVSSGSADENWIIGGSDLPSEVDTNARVKVLNSGVQVGIRRGIDFKSGSGRVVISGSDDSNNEKVVIDLDSKVDVMKGGTAVGSRGKLNFIEGSGISLTISDDATNSKVDITVSASGVAAHNLLSSAHSDTVAGNVSRGALIVGNSTPKWAVLSLGSAGSYLRSDGSDAKWDTIKSGDLPSVLDSNARVQVLSGGTVVGTRRGINFIAGDNITLSIADDSANERVNITISAAGGSGGGAHNLLSATHSDTVAASPVAGDLIYANSTPAWTRLPIGSAGYYLRSNGSLPSWSAIQSSDLPATINSNARVGVKNNGTLVGTRRAINLIAGTGITLSISDDSTNEDVDITISASGSGGGADSDLRNVLDNYGDVYVDVLNLSVVGNSPPQVSVQVRALRGGNYFNVNTTVGPAGLGNNYIWLNSDGTVTVNLSATPGTGQVLIGWFVNSSGAVTRLERNWKLLRNGVSNVKVSSLAMGSVASGSANQVWIAAVNGNASTAITNGKVVKVVGVSSDGLIQVDLANASLGAVGVALVADTLEGVAGGGGLRVVLFGVVNAFVESATNAGDRLVLSTNAGNLTVNNSATSGVLAIALTTDSTTNSVKPVLWLGGIK